MSGNRPMNGDGRSFKQCIQDCARDQRMVVAYNETCGAQLKAPIAALLKDGDLGLAPEESEQLVGFMLFVYATVWRKVLHAERRMTWLHVTGRDPTSSSADTGSEGRCPADAAEGGRSLARG